MKCNKSLLYNVGVFCELFFFSFTDLDKIQLRDLSKYKTSSPEERARNARIENALGDSQMANANPPLPPRGQTPQPYQHRASLAQFQPKSVYAQRSDSPGNRQSPFQRPNVTGATGNQDTGGGDARFGSSNYASPPNQTEPIHSRNTSAYDDSPSHLLPQQRHHPPPPRQQQYQQSPSGSDSNPSFARLNSRQSRASVLDEMTQPQPSKMGNHVPKGASWFATAASSSPYSSHSPPANSISGQRDGLNGYRVSTDFGSPASQTPPPQSHSTYATDRSTYANRIDVLDQNESAYQRNVALRRNSKPVSGDSPHSYKQASTLIVQCN